MDNKVELKLEDLAKVAGGELDPQVQEYILFVIGVAKEGGETLDSMLARLYANGTGQEAIDFFIANW